MMQRSGIMQTGVMQHDRSVLRRFLAKLVIDVLPAALASVIGGFLITQYQFNHVAALRPAAEQAAPASAEMMQLVRDEHAMIIDYLKTQMAAEKSRHAAEDEADARAVAEAAAASTAPTGNVAAAVVASKPVGRTKAAAAAAMALPPHAPLVIAQAEQDASAAPVAGTAREPKSLLAKTLDIKDHVVHATLHVVSAIGSIPSWIASMGDRIGGADTTSSSAGRLLTSSSS
jgi:hypothetical protein